MFFSMEHGFESDRSHLSRKDREQRETNQRLHDEFRAESSARCDAELSERWEKMELGMEEDDRRIQADLLAKGATEQLARMKEMGKYK
jgi:hypothetical protein